MSEVFLKDIYKAERDGEIGWLQLHRQYTQVYLTVNYVVIGVIFSAIWYAADKWNSPARPFLSLAVILPILNIALCCLGRRHANRIYQRFLESVTVQAKIEHLLGASLPRHRADERPFQNDDYIQPVRWIKARHDFPTAQEFIDAKMSKGGNRLVHWVYTVFIPCNVALIIAIPIIAWVD